MRPNDTKGAAVGTYRTPPEPPRHVPVATPGELVAAVEATYLHLGWDFDVMLAVVYRDEDGFYLRRAPFPLEVGQPWQVLRALSMGLWKSADRLDPMYLEYVLLDSFWGWLFVMEHYGVKAPGPDASPQERARIDRARRNRTFHLEHDRMEGRSVFAAGPDGEIGAITRHRGETATTTDPDAEFRGRVIEDLRRMTDACLRGMALRNGSAFIAPQGRP